LAVRSRKAGLRVAFGPEIARWIAARGFSAEHGARGIVRTVRKEVEAPLAETIVALSRGRSRSGRALARARIEDDRLVFDVDG
jgi:ATP-dependent Clp protease ATP-binding subunit ClpA